MELSQYTLEPLRKDGGFILYRGEHRNDIPYATLAQAFKTLVRSILSQSDVRSRGAEIVR